MKVNRIVANVTTTERHKADAFYGDILGLERLMDHGWFQAYGSAETMRVQLGFGSEGGSGAAVPDLSIEVDDLDEALRRMQQAGVPLEYGPVSEPWGVRRFYVRDPFDRLLNILQHE
ncbi:VOC family protein [Alcanivorax sp.]|uniref:VOC family protein n=1 Tax=Alcanivorax sp. TaxID=1872427 RepID=UPI000C4F9AE5|nr:VOC family protein [Alcanivorax sp.]MBQ25978.1 glyoxalase [Alcanivorax sp.]